MHLGGSVTVADDLSRVKQERNESSCAPKMADTTANEESAPDAREQSARSDSSFEVAYSSTVSFVRHTVRRLVVQRSDVDDVVQEVFLVAYRKWHSRDRGQSLHGWLHGIAVRVCWNHDRARRRRDRRHDRLAGEEDAERLDLAPDVEFEGRQSLDWLVGAIDRLDEKKRQALVLTRLEEKSATDVARMTGLSPHTVASRLRAALRDLRRAATDEAMAPSREVSRRRRGSSSK